MSQSAHAKLNLVLLAAGIGSRFGGLKQLEGLGPDGETLLELTVRDARACGFTRFVFVIRAELEEAFRERILDRLPAGHEVALAYQRLDDLPDGFAPPPGRSKPWGTTHALWAARAAIDGPFAVLNADDYYGRPALQALAGFLREPPAAAGRQHGCLVAYPLGRTLSPHGTVARGMIELDAAGSLRGIHERTGIAASPDGGAQVIDGPGAGERIALDAPVSMNCFGFSAGVPALLGAELAAFLRRHGNEPRSECFLPEAAAACARRGELDLAVLRADSPWFGVTYADDVPRVRAALAAAAPPDRR
jgi:hypothetical protein